MTFRIIFRIESFITIFSGLWALFWPESFFQSILPIPLDRVGLTLVRWSGILSIVLGTVLWLVIKIPNRSIIHEILIVYLLGDIIFTLFLKSFFGLVQEVPLSLWTLFTFHSVLTGTRAYFVMRPTHIHPG